MGGAVKGMVALVSNYKLPKPQFLKIFSVVILGALILSWGISNAVNNDIQSATSNFSVSGTVSEIFDTYIIVTDAKGSLKSSDGTYNLNIDYLKRVETDKYVTLGISDIVVGDKIVAQGVTNGYSFFIKRIVSFTSIPHNLAVDENNSTTTADVVAGSATTTSSTSESVAVASTTSTTESTTTASVSGGSAASADAAVGDTASASTSTSVSTSTDTSTDIINSTTTEDTSTSTPSIIDKVNDVLQGVIETVKDAVKDVVNTVTGTSTPETAPVVVPEVESPVVQESAPVSNPAPTENPVTVTE